MARFRNRRVPVDCEMAGPPGEAPGHVHEVDDAAGVTFQCAHCKLITVHSWQQVEAAALQCIADFADVMPQPDTIALPPCPACGSQAFLSHTDVEYGIELPHYYTAHAARQLIAKRPALAGRYRVGKFAGSDVDRHQGRDFSQLPKNRRPSWHEDLGADWELPAERRVREGARRTIGSGP